MPKKGKTNVNRIKILKFRPLGDGNQFERVDEILRTREFWCSRFWEMNDPMEGIYLGPNDPALARTIFDEKAKRLICSFSKAEALTNPLMWGYYANGFKGAAIEVAVQAKEVQVIAYSSELVNLSGGTIDNVMPILTNKLQDWEHEKEVRYIIDAEERQQKIGRITRVIFGMPYANALNHPDIEGRHRAQRDYHRRVLRLAETCRNRGIKMEQIRFRDAQLDLDAFNPGSFGGAI